MNTQQQSSTKDEDVHLAFCSWPCSYVTLVPCQSWSRESGRTLTRRKTPGSTSLHPCQSSSSLRLPHLPVIRIDRRADSKFLDGQGCAERAQLIDLTIFAKESAMSWTPVRTFGLGAGMINARTVQMRSSGGCRGSLRPFVGTPKEETFFCSRMKISASV